MNTLEALAGRLCFVRAPFDLGNVASAADAFGARLLLLDYIQRITPPGQHDNRRSSVDATMNYLRQFADAGVAVMVVSAVGRSKDKHGRNTYAGDELSLASYRESSELKFGADDAYILTPDGDADGGTVTLRHLKSRHGESLDLTLTFDGKRQLFVPTDAEPSNALDSGRLQSALAALWDRTPAAPEGANHDE